MSLERFQAREGGPFQVEGALRVAVVVAVVEELETRDMFGI